MSQTVIPLQFEQYLQNQISAGKAPDMNEMVFAYIPGLDPSAPIDRANGLPEKSLWVHTQRIDQVGKMGENALAYSVVIPSNQPFFTFNAIYLHDNNVANSCGMVVHKADETKELGMAITKSLVQAYDGAANVAGIEVGATTWQIDYQARLFGIEEEMRLTNLDTYGHTAFVDGFEVAQTEDETKCTVSVGEVYVGGLRAILDKAITQRVDTKPCTFYVDVVRQGSELSVWKNVPTILVSEDELTDYVDTQGHAHYLAKLASIDVNGTVTDLRVKGGLAKHEQEDNPHKQYPLMTETQCLEFNPERTYRLGELCFTTDADTGAVRYWQWYSNVESLAGIDPTNPDNRRPGWEDNTKPWYWNPYVPKLPGETLGWDSDKIPEIMVLAIGQQLPVAVYHRLAKAKPHWIDETDNTVINVPDRQGRFTRAANGSSWLVGETHEHAMQVIKGSFGYLCATRNNATAFGSGPFTRGASAGQGRGSGDSTAFRIEFDTSNSTANTGDETQPLGYIEWVGYAL
ncbi:phage tail protein [Vibrio olivae]|uniref:Phage tail protein n=1 Tax=Vibrio olivae TaxID=1243002 RepID=A0ABV5HNH3_9VIBR